ncbi:MAG: glycosyltransferase family 2 protein, partial [Bdellovibrionales bacterium]
MLSVIIITKNEEANIRACLESVKFADEIIVCDSGSTDKTLEICRAFTQQVFVTDWQGFGVQKQRALDKATQKWVLSIDADERISEELRAEILLAIKNDSCDGYFLPRLSYVCGERVRYGGWYPDYILRLFKKSSGEFTKDLVHEKVIVKGRTERLKNHILHYSYENLSQLILKMDRYSSLNATKEFKKNKDSSLITALGRATFAFVKSYFLKFGLFDGRVGFVVAVSSAESAYYKY